MPIKRLRDFVAGLPFLRRKERAPRLVLREPNGILWVEAQLDARPQDSTLRAGLGGWHNRIILGPRPEAARALSSARGFGVHRDFPGAFKELEFAGAEVAELERTGELGMARQHVSEILELIDGAPSKQGVIYALDHATKAVPEAFLPYLFEVGQNRVQRLMSKANDAHERAKRRTMPDG